jgi:pilus assembly protein CpaB
MRMTSTLRLAVYALMLISAAALAMLAYNLRPQSMHVEGSNPSPLQLNYLVAAHQLPAGTLAREEDFAVRTVLSGNLPPDAITDTPDARTSLRGSLIRNFIDTGNPITSADVLRPRDRGFIAAVLEPGTRAYAIAVDAVTGASGLIWPGDHVDVILTYEIANANAAHHVSSVTVISDIRVIAIDQNITQGAPSDNSVAGKVAKTVALQVFPKDAERIAAAEHLGKLSLSIHSAKDQPQTLSSIVGAAYGADVAPELGEATITVIQGDQSKVWSFSTVKGR